MGGDVRTVNVDVLDLKLEISKFSSTEIYETLISTSATYLIYLC